MKTITPTMLSETKKAKAKIVFYEVAYGVYTEAQHRAAGNGDLFDLGRKLFGPKS